MRARLIRTARTAFRGRLGRNAAWMTASYALRIVVQAAYFVVLARSLGVAGLGAFAAALALVGIVSPFAALGAGNVLVMDVAQERTTFSAAWGNALLAIPVAAVVLAPLAIVAAAVVVPTLSTSLVVAVAFAELLFMRAVDTSAQCFQAFERLRASALLGVLPLGLRLGAAVTFAVVGGSSPSSWAWVYAASTGTAAMAAFVTTSVALGRPRASLRGLARTVRVGFAFAVAQSAATIYGDIDKAMLARIASVGTAGVYAAGYRAVSIAFAPVMAMMYASYARFFIHGRDGVTATVSFARRLAPVAIAYGFGVALVLLAVAPLAPIVLGDEFSAASGVIRWLALMPLFQALLYLGGDCLSGAGKQRLRALLQVGAAVLNVGLNAILIPTHGWLGAAWSTNITFAALTTAVWVAVVASARIERHAANAGEATGRFARA